MRLRWKLFLTYLAVIAVIVGTVALLVRSVAVGAVTGHMGGLGGMMGSMHSDLELAIDRGVSQALLVAVVVAAVVAVGVSYVVSGWVTRPIHRSAQAARRIARGEYGQRVTGGSADEIGEFIEAFNEMAGELEAAEQRRAELLATISHEIRTPLATVRGYMDGLLDGVVPAEPETYVLVRREADRLTRLVGDIERLSRLEARAEPLTITTVDIASVAEQVIRGLRPLFEEKGLTLELEQTSPRPLVQADPDKVMQVLTNLLTNALKYTERGGVAIKVETDGPGFVRVTASDTGVGIPPDDLPHVFERFYRVDKSRSSEGGGAGIGLAVVRSLVTQMGGEVANRQCGRRGDHRDVHPPPQAGVSRRPSTTPEATSNDHRDANRNGLERLQVLHQRADFAVGQLPERHGSLESVPLGIDTVPDRASEARFIEGGLGLALGVPRRGQSAPTDIGRGETPHHHVHRLAPAVPAVAISAGDASAHHPHPGGAWDGSPTRVRPCQVDAFTE